MSVSCEEVMRSRAKAMRGKQSRAMGQCFEDMIIAAANYYEKKGICVVDKTPEPLKILGVYNRAYGQFICCFAKQAQPDFKGILCDSTMILFDAKHTDTEKISRNVVTKEQEKCFERYMEMGAMCFIVVSLGFKDFYRIPWVVFRDMKKIYGHAYMNQAELSTYAVKYKEGILRFLDGIELKGSVKSENTEI